MFILLIFQKEKAKTIDRGYRIKKTSCVNRERQIPNEKKTFSNVFITKIFITAL